MDSYDDFISNTQGKVTELGAYPHDFIRRIYNKKLVVASIKNKLPTLVEQFTGDIASMEDFFSELKFLGGVEYFRELYKGRPISVDFAWDDSWVGVNNKILNESIEVSVSTLNPLLLEQVRLLAKKYLTKRIVKGQIFTLATQGDGLVLTALGKISLPFEPDNYAPHVIEEVKHIVEDLKKPNPCGKLSIIDGPPGTGKTSLIKMIIGTNDMTFILVPAHQVVDWSNPGLISILKGRKEEFATSPIFILEDADDCLVPRTAQNMNAISALLNLSDGILGSVFDLRIIATTNAKIDDIDEAITRDGRLCKRVLIGSLDKVQANRIYQRLTGKTEELFDAPVTLAEVYKATRDSKRVESLVKRKTARIGFTS